MTPEDAALNAIRAAKRARHYLQNEDVQAYLPTSTVMKVQLPRMASGEEDAADYFARALVKHANAVMADALELCKQDIAAARETLVKFADD